ncbi:hypothetical protein RDV78_08620 [Bacillota bacterium LX-D]|nr:hypothetical protein [Bacillota bacterium LX-D]
MRNHVRYCWGQLNQLVQNHSLVKDLTGRDTTVIPTYKMGCVDVAKNPIIRFNISP